MKVYEEYQYGGYRECLKTAPLRYSGGSLGGGTENIVVEDMVYPIEGNGSRESHHAPGYNEPNKMYTLNTVERHTVAQVSTGGGYKWRLTLEILKKRILTVHCRVGQVIMCNRIT